MKKDGGSESTIIIHLSLFWFMRSTAQNTSQTLLDFGCLCQNYIIYNYSCSTHILLPLTDLRICVSVFVSFLIQPFGYVSNDFGCFVPYYFRSSTNFTNTLVVHLSFKNAFSFVLSSVKRQHSISECVVVSVWAKKTKRIFMYLCR